MLWEHELQAIISTVFRVVPNSHESFYYSIETQHFDFDYQSVIYVCSRHHYVNSSC